VGRPRVESRTARLEERLEDLVSLLQRQVGTGAGSGAGSASTTTTASASNDGSPDTSIGHAPPVPTPSTTAGSRGPGLPAQQLVASTSTASPEESYAPPTAAFAFAHAITAEEAEECLRVFGHVIVPWFPFYRVVAGSALRVSQERPLLWLAILAITVKSLRRQMVLSDKFRQIVVERVVLGCDRSLDLLLGLLVHVAWCVAAAP
jgi:hypothetical protein